MALLDRLRLRWELSAAVAAAMLACGPVTETPLDDGGTTSDESDDDDDDDDDDGGDTAQPTTTPTSATTTATTATGAGESSGTDATSEGGDVDPDGTGEEDGDASGSLSCGAIDFLVIVDNSGSMADEQQRLVTSFPAFAGLFASQDTHVMVIDVDAYVFGQCNDVCQSCVQNGLCDSDLPGCANQCFVFQTCVLTGQTCSEVVPLDACEETLGAGVVHPRGNNSSNMDCGFTSGGRYIDSTQPDFDEAFTCAATVGTGSLANGERPMEAMVQAVAPATAASTCNAGFLRDDALLVVLFLTDEDDAAGEDSAGTPAGWKANLVAAKGGNEDAIVALGLFGDNDQPDAICPPFEDQMGAEPAPRLREFVNSFGDNGLAGSICASDYSIFLDQAAMVVDQACADL